MERRLDAQSEVLKEIALQMRHEREIREKDRRSLVLELQREIDKLERRLPPSSQ